MENGATSDMTESNMSGECLSIGVYGLLWSPVLPEEALKWTEWKRSRTSSDVTCDVITRLCMV